ncbi:ATP-binding protein [Actinoplanes sp. NPDC051851]|uniref:ATP-binding protein n=1 Tax=Actinoplanes sp. NPDC051851 TaxID=3154753 RepID=UPI003449CB86
MSRLQDTVDALRRASFVGREPEIALFREVLATAGVLFVHGPGGVGKSALLDVFAATAAEQGRIPVRVDARYLALGPGSLPTVPDGGRPVLLIDTYELLEPIDDWARDRYLPSLPAGCPVVIAGRRPPGPGWRADPAWRALTRVVALDGLPDADGRAYLAGQGVPEAVHDQLLAIGHGHPLTLALLADAVARGVTPRSLRDVPDVVSALVARLVEAAPGPRHRAALEACALVPATTEDYLRAMVGGDAAELFAWLRGQPFIGESPYGLYPHDVVRDVLEADLRWRDPARYAETFLRKLVAFRERVRAVADERERFELVARMVVLNGGRSPVAGLSALPPPLGGYADGLRDADHGPVVAMTAAWQGAEQADLVAYWMRRQPSAFRVFRTGEGLVNGYAACLDLTEDDLGVDPGAEAMWHFVAKNGAPRPGERVRAWRFFLDRECGQAPSPSTTLFVACQMLDILQLTGDTAWTLTGAWADGDRWRPAMEFLDFLPAPDADYRIGDAWYPVFAHDWRRAGAEEWTRALHARQMGAPVRPAQAAVPLLGRDEFTDAVRSALRVLTTPEALAANPLLRSRMVRRRSERPPAEVLRGLVEEAAGALEPALAELVTRTFLRPATTQQRVAVGLHLSFNTYRRHRDRAVGRIAALLWAEETGSRTDRVT